MVYTDTLLPAMTKLCALAYLPRRYPSSEYLLALIRIGLKKSHLIMKVSKLVGRIAKVVLYIKRWLARELCSLIS